MLLSKTAITVEHLIMDLLKLLQLDELPEQQTRTRHLTKDYPDFQLHLGFDACCCCGKPDPSVECGGCHRVKYCSKACREIDGNLSKTLGTKTSDVDDPTDEEGEDPARGHSAVICSILQLISDDEEVENSTGTSKVSLDEEKRSAAIDRLASELESFPATLANIVMDGPCYQDVLHRNSGDTMTIHIVGASQDAELPDSAQEKRAFHSYGEALADIAESHSFRTIQLVFVGPECPEKNIQLSIPIPAMKKNKSSCELLVQTHFGKYTSKEIDNGKIPSADIVVFFNPGFTCPDYEWEDALHVIPPGTPLLVTTNTELEGIADAQYLLDRDLIQHIPPGLEDILGISDGSSTESDSPAFFSVNPNCGTRVRQSGTMANDLYVKNRWIFGTIRGRRSQSFKDRPAKKLKIEGSGNTKKSNPALV